MSHPDSLHAPSTRRWYHRIGPGLVTSCVVIGPGSILTSSKVGAANGYSMCWVVAIAVIFMMVYMQLWARLGVTAGESPGELITNRSGRPLAALRRLVGILCLATLLISGCSRSQEHKESIEKTEDSRRTPKQSPTAYNAASCVRRLSSVQIVAAGPGRRGRLENVSRIVSRRRVVRRSAWLGRRPTDVVTLLQPAVSPAGSKLYLPNSSCSPIVFAHHRRDAFLLACSSFSPQACMA